MCCSAWGVSWQSLERRLSHMQADGRRQTADYLSSHSRVSRLWQTGGTFRPSKFSALLSVKIE